MSFCIFLIDGVQSLHQQIFVVHHVVAAVSGDHRCVWAGGHDGWLRPAQRLTDTVDDPIQHGGGAVDDKVYCFLKYDADELPGVLQRDIGQLRRMMGQRIQRQPHAGEHQSALVGALL